MARFIDQDEQLKKNLEKIRLKMEASDKLNQVKQSQATTIQATNVLAGQDSQAAMLGPQGLEMQRREIISDKELVKKADAKAAEDIKDDRIAGAQIALKAAMAPGQTSSSAGIAESAAGLGLAGYAIEGGPVGAVVGAGVGGVVGALKSRAARKARERELENQKLQQISAIEGQKANRINQAIASMGARLSSALRVPIVRL